MARTTKTLSNTQIEKAKPKDKPYKLIDGQGLFLSITPNGSKLWRFNYYKPFTTPPKRTEISLGSFPDLSLAEARAIRKELFFGLSKRRGKPNKKKSFTALWHIAYLCNYCPYGTESVQTLSR